MGSISAGNQVLLRQPVDSQHSVERLYFQGFDNFWTGRVNEDPARGDRTVTFDGGAMAAGFAWADLSAFAAGLEIWFGSSVGGKERGTRRVRSITSADNGVTGTIVTEWYDDMNVADDDYISIKHVYPPWPKYSWFTATGPEFRKDGPDGTLYAASGDANDTPAPHVVMGRNYANEMPAAGTIAIQCDASNSQDVAGGGGAVTYAWDITPAGGASFDDDTSATPVLTITTEGKYQLHCTVTIDGRSTTAHRAVIVGGGIAEFSRTPIVTKWDSTDVSCQVTLTSPETGTGIRGIMTWADVQDHGLAIIATDDWYGGTQGTISMYNESVYDDRDHIVFCGYLLAQNDDLVEDGSGQVTLTAVSLLDIFLYSLSITGVTNATQWYEMNQDLMTVAGNLLHLFRWQSTLLDIADWWLPWSDTVLRSANEEFSEGDMLERARALARARIMGITVNSQGEVFVETDLNVRSEADRNAATVTMTADEDDVAGTKRVRKRRRGDTVRVLADGGYSTGVMGSFQPYFAASQNVARAEGHAIPVHVDRLMLPSQTEANRIAARLAAVANRTPYEVDLEFRGNYWAVFSPAPQQWYNLGNLFAAAVQANITRDTDLVSARIVPREVTHLHDNASGYTSVSVVFDVEAPVELAGRTITPPVVPSEDPGDFTWDFPEPPAWPETPPNEAAPGAGWAEDDAMGVYFRYESGVWEERNTGLPAGDTRCLIWDPWQKAVDANPENARLYSCGVEYVAVSEDGGKAWTDLTPTFTDPTNSWEDTPAPTAADLTYVQVHADTHNNGTFYVLTTWQEAGGDWRSWILKTGDRFATHDWTPMRLLETNDDGDIFASGISSITDAFPVTGKVNVTNAAAMLGEDDGNVAEYTYEYVGGNGYDESYTVVDLGASVSGVALQVDVKNSSEILPPSTRQTFNRNDLLFTGTDPGGPWTDRTPVGGWYSTSELESTPLWGNQTAAFNATIRYIRLRFEPPWEFGNPGADGAQGWIDAIRVQGATLPDQEIQALAMDLDDENGTQLYVTTWNGVDDTLELWVYNTASMTRSQLYVLGDAVEAEVAARTYWAVPRCPFLPGTASFGDQVYIFGRWDDGTEYQLWHSTDSGVTFTDLSAAAWAGMRVGALSTAGAPTDLFAFVNDAAAPALYRTQDTGTNWQSILALPFSVEWNAVTRHPDGTFAAAANDAIAGPDPRAISIPSPYLTYADMSGTAPDDLPDAGDGSTGWNTLVWYA